MPPLEGDIW